MHLYFQAFIVEKKQAASIYEEQVPATSIYKEPVTSNKKYQRKSTYILVTSMSSESQNLKLQQAMLFLNLLSANITEWSNTLKQFVGKLFDHFVGLALKGLLVKRQRSHLIRNI